MPMNGSVLLNNDGGGNHSPDDIWNAIPFEARRNPDLDQEMVEQVDDWVYRHRQKPGPR